MKKKYLAMCLLALLSNPSGQRGKGCFSRKKYNFFKKKVSENLCFLGKRRENYFQKVCINPVIFLEVSIDLEACVCYFVKTK